DAVMVLLLLVTARGIKAGGSMALGEVGIILVASSNARYDWSHNHAALPVSHRRRRHDSRRRCARHSRAGHEGRDWPHRRGEGPALRAPAALEGTLEGRVARNGL